MRRTRTARLASIPYPSHRRQIVRRTPDDPDGATERRGGGGSITHAFPTDTFRYKAFISYSWADRKWGEWLHSALETYRAPKTLNDGKGGARLHPIFKDREEEAAGHSIGAAIEAAMGSSEFLIVVCSPRSAKSQWVNREVAWFKTHRDASKILAIIVDGEPMASLTPGREADECFPQTLLHQVDADLQPTAAMEEVPLAADARETGDGKRGAKLKLAAAMLGVGYDALQRRDDRRRAQRRRMIMGAMAASIALLGGLTLFAFNQRDAAIAARNEAVVARNDAQFQRDEAQSLVEFMLTDLRQRLDAVGRLDILDTVAERLNESYAKQDLSKLDADALGRRARVQLLLGEVDNTRGNLDAALAQYKEAAATTEELLNRNPGKAQQIFDHAQSVFWVGYIAWQRGDAAETKKYFTQYKDYADELVAIDPENEDWLAEVDYANSNLGTLAMDQGEPAEAEAYFRKSLAVSAALAAASAGKIDRAIALGQSYAWLADSLLRQSKFSTARDARESELTVYERALLVDPANSALNQRALTANQMLSQIDTTMGDLELALSSSLKAAKIADKFLKIEPENTQQMERTASANTTLAVTLFHLGRTSEALEAARKSELLAKRLMEKDRLVTEWRGQTLARARIILARLEVDAGRVDSAREILLETIEQLRPMISLDTDPNIVQNFCAALAGSARIDKKSRRNWSEIIDLLSPAPNMLGPESLFLLAEAYAQMELEDKATAIAVRLYAAGYRHPDFLALLEEFPVLKVAAMTGMAQ